MAENPKFCVNVADGSEFRKVMKAAVAVTKSKSNGTNGLYMNHIHVMADGEKITVTATDGHVLYRGSIAAGGDSADFLVHSAEAKRIADVLVANRSSGVSLEADGSGNMAARVFTSQPVVMWKNQEDGYFPSDGVNRVIEGALADKPECTEDIVMSMSVLETYLGVVKALGIDKPKLEFFGMNSPMRTQVEYGSTKHLVLVMRVKDK